MDWLTPLLMIAFGFLTLGFEALLKKVMSKSTHHAHQASWHMGGSYFSLARIAHRMESRSRWSVFMILVGGIWLGLELLY